ncbi:YfcC family protein [Parvibacter caecicola]|uniref:YfcC family protein n=1 Tax=Parvibacter caecicola TaxID=747645 RepID=A0A4T9T6K2_9ACTN|nr:YfcC family protein [Parvibacter caecicola]TJW09930.1 YfcC family protein [Parvibacter caecicola]
MAEAAKKKIQIPHTYTIIFLLMIVVAILTWIVPSGAFETAEVNGREVTVAGTYQEVDKVSVDPETGKEIDLRQGFDALLEAPVNGIVAAAEVVAFVFVVGGAFQIITATGAIDAGMRRVVRRFKKKDIIVIPIAMLLFALGGSTFGMAEETLPFFAIFLPIMISMGFDSITAFMIVFIGAKAGYIASTVNPFSVLVSQGILGITGNPQLWLRLIMFVVIVGMSIAWVMLYARKVRKNPEKSLTYKDDLAKRAELEKVADDTPFTARQKWILLVFLAGMVLLVWGLVTQGWYMAEVSAIFMGMGLISGIIAGFSQGKIAQEFVVGLKDFAFSAIVIGLARGVLVIATNGMIIDTILNALANGLAGVAPAVYSSILYIVENLLTILVPSSSGLAALTMPIFGPLTELMGLNPEGAVTAVCLAEPMMTIIAPTSAILVAGLAVCKVSLGQWWKTCWKWWLLMSVVCMVFCAISATIPLP